MAVYISNSEHETELIGQRFAEGLPGGTVVAMYGDLGAGKTAFVRGMARGMGLDCRVSSPTFTIVNEYLGERELIHFDMYRLSDADELYGMGLDEYIPAEDGASFIEWPQMAQEAMPEDALHVHIAYAEDGAARVATLEADGTFDEARIDEIKRRLEADDEHPDD